MVCIVCHMILYDVYIILYCVYMILYSCLCDVILFHVILYCDFPHLWCGVAIVSWVRVCKDCGRVRTLWIQLAAGSNAMHEVSHGMLFTTQLARSAGEAVEVVLWISRDWWWGCVWAYVRSIAWSWDPIPGPSNAHNSAHGARTELRIELPASLQHKLGPEIGLSPWK